MPRHGRLQRSRQRTPEGARDVEPYARDDRESVASSANLYAGSHAVLDARNVRSNA